jgi:eukaryotic-like serine/threonine-protein kinase
MKTLLIILSFVFIISGCDDSESSSQIIINNVTCSPEKSVSCSSGTVKEYNVCVDLTDHITIERTPFLMGGLHGDNPEHIVTLSEFTMDKFEITNKKYQGCVNQCICTPPSSSLSYSARHNYTSALEYENFPVVYVTWEQAMIYCQGLGKSLPTEAQWELAAKSKENYDYPWGDTDPVRSMANFGQPMLGDTEEVGTYESGKSWYGMMDMAGNVWEWVYDYYSQDYYEANMVNPTGPETGTNRVVRGGSFASEADKLNTKRRTYYQGDSEFSTVGFRCVTNSEEI